MEPILSTLYCRPFALSLTMAIVFWAFTPSISQAQFTDPGAREDAAQERQKILRAADQLDRLVRDVEKLQAEIEKLRKESADLRKENADLNKKWATQQTKLKALAAEGKKSREALLKEVTKIIAESAPQEEAPAGEFYEHTVAKGENLTRIAKAYRDAGGSKKRPTVADIRKANKLKSDQLSIGQKLLIPKFD